jgi:hypothetical protein
VDPPSEEFLFEDSLPEESQSELSPLGLVIGRAWVSEKEHGQGVGPGQSDGIYVQIYSLPMGAVHVIVQRLGLM